MVVDATPAQSQTAGIERAPWGAMPSGEPVDQYTLTNARGTQIRVITLGAIITSIIVPDKSGAPDDIALGMTDVNGYLTKSPYFGAVVGRYGNRIAKGKFTLDGTTYSLAVNNGPNHLHGGLVGFDKRLWTGSVAKAENGVGLRLALTSADGDQGYPGELRVTVRYVLTNDDRLIIDYDATTSKATVLNLTQHTYFNLSGRMRENVLEHQLMLNADRFLVVDSTLIPTGVLAPVTGTPFDFRTATAIGKRINAPNAQIKNGGGYDHSFALTRKGAGLEHAAQVFDPVTGRTLDVWTTEPGIQVYTGNFLDGTVPGKGGRKYQHRGAICLETGHFPDSPNHPAFPSTVLRPGQKFHSQTIYGFGVRR